jgi:hypothetical protein
VQSGSVEDDACKISLLAGFQEADGTIHAQHPRALDGGHADDFRRRHRLATLAEQLLEHRHRTELRERSSVLPLIGPSVAMPTGMPAARSVSTGAMPRPALALERALCATQTRALAILSISLSLR